MNTQAGSRRSGGNEVVKHRNTNDEIFQKEMISSCYVPLTEDVRKEHFNDALPITATGIMVPPEYCPKLGGLCEVYFPLHGKFLARPMRINSDEVEVLNKLRSLKHPNILTWMDFGLLQKRGDVTLTMLNQWCDGKRLINLIHKQRVPFPLYTKLWISQQIAEALIYLHKQGLKYCGITSYKMLLQSDNTLKLGEFRASPSDYFYWTHWSAPEESYHIPLSQRYQQLSTMQQIDTYAFGIILLELLTQTFPFNFVYNSLFLMYQIEKNRIRPTMQCQPDGSPPSLQNIIVWNQLKGCVNFNFQTRPKLKQVKKILKNLQSVTPNFQVEND